MILNILIYYTIIFFVGNDIILYIYFINIVNNNNISKYILIFFIYSNIFKC